MDGIPTQRELDGRRESRLITPIPKPKKRGGKAEQALQRSLEIEAQAISTDDQQYEVTQQINSIRALVEEWRQAPESQWKVSAETALLLPDRSSGNRDLTHGAGTGEQKLLCWREEDE